MRDNILLITTDQQRFDTINALGNHSIFTPHLNYLASTGIAFTRCYADCPICVPSRTTIMTGKRGFESGVISNATHESVMCRLAQSRATLPAMLTDAGYQTKAMGKMHFEPARAHYGFEEMTLPLDYLRECEHSGKPSPKAHGIGECEMEPVISTADTKNSITQWIADSSIDFLQTRDPLRPFFMWTSFTKPHPPFDPSRDFWALYDNIPMPPPVYGDWSETLCKTPQGFLEGAYVNTNMHHFGPEQIAASRRAYYACISQVDYALGRLLGALRENNLFENTWLIFTADHGEMLGDHWMSQKNLFFEGSAHIPLIIVPPQGRNCAINRQENTLVEIADIFPTILDMAGIKAPEGINGQSLLQPVLKRAFYGNSLDTHFCVIQDNMKLVYCTVGGHILLFDLKKDPMEQHNLVQDAAYAETRERLWKMLLAHTAKHRSNALKDNTFITREAPKGFSDIKERWFGFHYRDYSVDTFH